MLERERARAPENVTKRWKRVLHTVLITEKHVMHLQLMKEVGGHSWWGKAGSRKREIDISSCLGDYTANSKPTMCRAPRAQHTGDRHDLIPHYYLSVWWCMVDVLGQASPGWQVLPHLIYDWLPEKGRQWRHQRFSEKLRDFPIRGTNGPKRRCKIKLCGQNYFYPIFWKKVCKIKRCISVYKYFLWGC